MSNLHCHFVAASLSSDKIFMRYLSFEDSFVCNLLHLYFKHRKTGKLSTSQTLTHRESSKSAFIQNYALVRSFFKWVIIKTTSKQILDFCKILFTVKLREKREFFIFYSFLKVFKVLVALSWNGSEFHKSQI